MKTDIWDLGPIGAISRADHVNEVLIRTTYDYSSCSKKHRMILPIIKNVEFNPPLTIIIWSDNTKTFVKCGELDNYDPEKGLAMAIAKKALGNKYKSTEMIDEWVTKKYLKED